MTWTAQPLCFVLMPFGNKPDAEAERSTSTASTPAIAPAIERAGLRCIRPTRRRVGGIIHKPMFERLLICEYAVADLTSANANVYYELGVRHAVGPGPRSWSRRPGITPAV